MKWAIFMFVLCYVANAQKVVISISRCSDAQISSKKKFPTFTRMEPPDTQVNLVSYATKLLVISHYFKPVRLDSAGF